MEAGLTDKSDYNRARDRLRETRAELTDLKEEKAKLVSDITTLKVLVGESEISEEDKGPNSTVHEYEDSSSEEVPR